MYPKLTYKMSPCQLFILLTLSPVVPLPLTHKVCSQTLLSLILPELKWRVLPRCKFCTLQLRRCTLWKIYIEQVRFTISYLFHGWIFLLSIKSMTNIGTIMRVPFLGQYKWNFRNVIITQPRITVDIQCAIYCRVPEFLSTVSSTESAPPPPPQVFFCLREGC